MSITTVVRCNQCGTEEEVDRGGVILPFGWHTADGRHFCTYDCLARWALRMATPDTEETN